MANWKHWIWTLSRFFGDRRGNVALMFGMSLMPVILGFGMAVDYSRAIRAKQHMARAADAAALAIASSPGLTEQQMQQIAQDYVNANFTPGTYGVTPTLQVTQTGQSVQVTISGNVDTTFMSVAGVTTMPVHTHTEVVKGEKSIELIMVLDNTGSMGWSGKMTALKSAAHTLVDHLFGDEAQSQFVKVGLVPFAAAVNIGSDKLSSGWIDTTAQSSLAGEDFQPGVNVLDLYTQITNRSWNGCVRARPSPLDVQDSEPNASFPNTLWVPYFAPDGPDFWGYANRYAWDGSYGGSYYNYDARQRYIGKYSSLTLSTWEDDGPDFNCRTPEVTPLNNTKATIETAIDDMVTEGSTVIPAGLAWGWRLISPEEPFSEGVAYDDSDTVKAMILLTDGRNDVGGGLSNHNNSYYSAYGFATSGHLGSTSGNQSESVLDDKTETLCTSIKAAGIRLYTITFKLNDGPIKDLMRDCASSPSMYYDSPDNDELTVVFEDIAKGLNELRIAK